MKYSFHPTAEMELNRAVDYYEECQKGLGVEFLKEIYRTVQNVLSFPLRMVTSFRKHPKVPLEAFSLWGIYQLVGEEAFIIAVMNLSREPDYWTGREHGQGRTSKL